MWLIKSIILAIILTSATAYTHLSYFLTTLYWLEFCFLSFSYEAGEKYNSWIGIATFVFINNPSKLEEIHSNAQVHPNQYQTTSIVSFSSTVPSPRYHVVDRKKPLPSDSLTSLLSRASSHVPCWKYIKVLAKSAQLTVSVTHSLSHDPFIISDPNIFPIFATGI